MLQIENLFHNFLFAFIKFYLIRFHLFQQFYSFYTIQYSVHGMWLYIWIFSHSSPQFKCQKNSFELNRIIVIYVCALCSQN